MDQKFDPVIRDRNVGLVRWLKNKLGRGSDRHLRKREPIPRHQMHNGTFAGRHQALMRDIHAAMIERARPVRSILSFGCSTGEECTDLANVFRDAQVTGLEINDEIRAIAKRVEGPRIRIMNSTSDTIASGAPYDVILALNVLCLSPQTKGLDYIADLYSFQQFADAVALLDGHLKPGGVLAIYNANYFFEDTQQGHRYTPLPQPSFTGSGWIEKCTPNGDRVCRTLFREGDTEYMWPEWDRFIRDNPNVNPVKHGRYRQVWIDGRERPGYRTDAALWLKKR